jgi:hypothetical protein
VNELPRDLSAVGRARWLAELSEALEQADRLASRLGLSCVQGSDAMELFIRLAAARSQMQALRLGRPDDGLEDADPKWSNPPLWPTEPSGRATHPGEDPPRR